jgi:hypothetical protein
MSNATTDGAAQAEIAASKVDAEEMLPKLLDLRQRLEREAGIIGVKERNAYIFLVACASIAGVSGAYSLFRTFSEATSITAWVVTGVFAACAFAAHKKSTASASERRGELATLHAKMLGVGRQIDRAERILRR